MAPKRERGLNPPRRRATELRAARVGALLRGATAFAAGPCRSSGGGQARTLVAQVAGAARLRPRRVRRPSRLPGEALDLVAQHPVSEMGLPQEGEAPLKRLGRDVRRMFNACLTWARFVAAAAPRASAVDAKLSEYFEFAFFKGHQPTSGEKTVVSVLHFWPPFGRRGSESLPRAWRGTRGRRRMYPGISHMPGARPDWAALATALIYISGTFR